MTELTHLRRHASEDSSLPGQALEPLPVSGRACEALDDATWVGDFSTPGFGFGHIKALRQPAPDGGLGLGGDSLHIIAVCDGFHRGSLADPDLHLWMIVGPQHWTQSAENAAVRQLGHIEADILLRAATNWKHEWGSGRSPELQLGAVHLSCQTLEKLSAEQSALAFYFELRSGKGSAYINLDGVPEKNFILQQHFFAPLTAREAPNF